MIKRNQWYKLTEQEFTNILRFVDKDIANNEKYIESLNRVGDAYSKYKVLYVQLQFHHFPSQSLYNKFYAWHYRSSYSEYYCGQCLEYTDIVFDKCSDDNLTAEQIRKRVEKLMLNSVYGARRFPTMCDSDAFDAMFYANWDANKENKEEKVMEENKIQAINNIINKYEGDADRELYRQYDEQEKEVKEKDPNVIALKQYVEVLNKNRAENTEPYNIIGFNEIYTAETATQLDKLYNTLMGKKRALREQCDEVRNLCMLCDTYEQMRQVLADYDIIPNTKKRGK